MWRLAINMYEIQFFLCLLNLTEHVGMSIQFPFVFFYDA